MARSQFTFTFPNAQPGAPVTFSAAVYSSKVDATADGPTLVLDAQRTVAVWTDATELTATWKDGSGASIAAEASLDRPVVTAIGGVPGQPTAASSASWMAKKTVTFDIPDNTLLGIDLAAGSQVLGAHVVIRTEFDGILFFGVVGSTDPNNEGGISHEGGSPWAYPFGGTMLTTSQGLTVWPLNVSADASLAFFSQVIIGRAALTQGDMDVWLLVQPPPVDL